MNFLLKNLELELDEHHLVVGEKLMDDGKVHRLFENERHLWIAQVDVFEVEIQISPSKVKACSCECETFVAEGMCGHVAASLLLLRRQLSEQKTEPAQTRNQPHAYQKLTVTAILDNVTSDELAAFVRNFSKTNKQFSLALRARFAAKVPMADNREKFGHILDAAILAARKANDHISASGAKQLQKMLVELLHQTDDALALEHYADGWAILSAIIGRLSPILRKLDGDGETIRKPLDETFSKIEKLAINVIPPDLQEEIRQFGLDEFNRPAYRLNGFSGRLLGIVFLLSSDLALQRELLQTLDAELAKSFIQPEQRSQVLLVKLDLLEKTGLKAEAEAFTLDCLSEPALLGQVLDAVEGTGSFVRLKSLVEKARRLLSEEEIISRLDGILLQIAQQEGEADVITTIARQKFIESKDFKFYEECRTHYSGEWPSFVKELLSDLVVRYNFKQNLHVIANILGKEGMLDDLLRWVDEQQSLEFLQSFDHFLLKTRPKEVFELYNKLLIAYLTDHLGLKASKHMRKFLSHLQRQGADKIADKLLGSIRTTFPKRKFYLDDIEAFGLF